MVDKLNLTFGILIGLGILALCVIYFFPEQTNKVSDLSQAIKRMAVGH